MSSLTTGPKSPLLRNAFHTLDVGAVMRYAAEHHLLRKDLLPKEQSQETR